jgi:hypothetical protein
VPNRVNVVTRNYFLAGKGPEAQRAASVSSGSPTAFGLLWWSDSQTPHPRRRGRSPPAMTGACLSLGRAGDGATDGSADDGPELRTHSLARR